MRSGKFDGVESGALVKAFAIAAVILPTSFVTRAWTGVENNTVTCVLQRTGSEFAGMCAIPCSVNALAIDIDGPNAKKACDSPPRTVQARLRQVGVGDWLGTMQGKFPEDPTRFEVVSSAQTPGIAKTPFGWFLLQDVRLDDYTLRLTIAANNQLPPTLDDIRIIERAQALLSNEESWNRADDRTCPSNPKKMEFVLCA